MSPFFPLCAVKLTKGHQVYSRKTRLQSFLEKLSSNIFKMLKTQRACRSSKLALRSCSLRYRFCVSILFEVSALFHFYQPSRTLLASSCSAAYFFPSSLVPSVVTKTALSIFPLSPSKFDLYSSTYLLLQSRIF